MSNYPSGACPCPDLPATGDMRPEKMSDVMHAKLHAAYPNAAYPKY
jgi:hypothetical protein